MVGSASRAVMAARAYQKINADKAKKRAKELAKVKGETQKNTQSSPQAIAAQQAKQSAQNAINAKKEQRRSFKDYLARQPSSLGPIGKLPPKIQQQIASQFTPSERRKLMNKIDKEASSGEHR